MNPPDPQATTSSPTARERRDAWDELLLRRSLLATARDETSTDERWRRISRRISAHEQLRTINETMALRGSELRRMLVLSRPWPSLLPLFS